MKLGKQRVFGILMVAALQVGAAGALAQNAPAGGGAPGTAPPLRAPHMAPMVSRTLAPKEANISLSVPGGSEGPIGSLKLEYSGLTKPEGGSPPLAWTPGPAGTRSYVVVLQDMPADADMNAFLHWAMYNIPADVTALPAHIPAGTQVQGVKGAIQLQNSRELTGYLPPGPPWVKIPTTLAGGENEMSLYTLQIFALSSVIDGNPANLEALVEAMKGKVLGYGVHHMVLQMGKRPPAGPPAGAAPTGPAAN